MRIHDAFCSTSNCQMFETKIILCVHFYYFNDVKTYVLVLQNSILKFNFIKNLLFMVTFHYIVVQYYTIYELFFYHVYNSNNNTFLVKKDFYIV